MKSRFQLQHLVEEKRGGGGHKETSLIHLLVSNVCTIVPKYHLYTKMAAYTSWSVLYSLGTVQYKFLSLQCRNTESSDKADTHGHRGPAASTPDRPGTRDLQDKCGIIGGVRACSHLEWTIRRMYISEYPQKGIQTQQCTLRLQQNTCSLPCDKFQLWDRIVQQSMQQALFTLAS